MNPTRAAVCFGVLALTTLLVCSGCTTFQNNELPKQSGKPNAMGGSFFITEDAQFVNYTPMPMFRCMELFLDRAIADAGGHYTNILSSYVSEKVLTFSLLSRKNKCQALRLCTWTYVKEWGREEIVYDYSVANGISEEKMCIMWADKTFREGVRKMRADTTFRRNIMPAGVYWLDCSSVVTVRRNDFYNILAACTLLVAPVFLDFETASTVQFYTDEGRCVASHSYKDSYDLVGWIPFFPFMLFEDQSVEDQSTWEQPYGNECRGAPVPLRKKMAILIVNDLAKDRANVRGK